MNFFGSFIKMLIDEGHTVDIATNETDKKVPQYYRDWGCKVYPISYVRSPFSSGNVRAISQIKNIVKANKYDIVHCHTPIASVCTRLACKDLRKQGLQVIYTAHGFHFYKGAPLKNWLIYYPVEKLCSYWTDVLITINQEDYVISSNRLKAIHNIYVPGVGIDVLKFSTTTVDRYCKRREIGIPDDSFMMLSVGELNRNKNHEVIIRAMAELKNESIHYVIAGMGSLETYLEQLATDLGVLDHVHLLGFRDDIPELNKVADVFCFPSIREGLGVAAIEGMATGLPLIVSDNRGTRAYAIHNVNAIVCSPSDIEAWKLGIERLCSNSKLCSIMGKNNQEIVVQYDISKINKQMKEIYGL